MRIRIVEISLAELQQALREHMKKTSWTTVEEVRVVSFDKIVLNVDLRPKGLVQGVEFLHRSEE